MPDNEVPLEITVTAAQALVEADPAGVRILDVREPHELAICRVAGAEFIPMRQIPAQVPTLARDVHWLVLCHHGVRSLRVTEFLRAQGFANVSNIAGGIEAWAEHVDPTLARY